MIPILIKLFRISPVSFPPVEGRYTQVIKTNSYFSHHSTNNNNIIIINVAINARTITTGEITAARLTASDGVVIATVK